MTAIHNLNAASRLKNLNDDKMLDLYRHMYDGAWKEVQALRKRVKQLEMRLMAAQAEGKIDAPWLITTVEIDDLAS